MRVELPEPTPEERAHCERVAALIRNEIAAAGDSIDFARYMELALYAPGLGYYSAGAAKFGAAGDFITAPELGCVFARCFARAIAPVLRETQGDILELGPGCPRAIACSNAVPICARASARRSRRAARISPRVANGSMRRRAIPGAARWSPTK